MKTKCQRYVKVNHVTEQFLRQISEVDAERRLRS